MCSNNVGRTLGTVTQPSLLVVVAFVCFWVGSFIAAAFVTQRGSLNKRDGVRFGGGGGGGAWIVSLLRLWADIQLGANGAQEV